MPARHRRDTEILRYYYRVKFLIDRHRHFLILGILSLIATDLAGIALPWLIKGGIDTALSTSDPERSLQYTGSRSTEDGLVVLAGFAPLQVVPYEEQRTPFLLLRTVRGEADDWLEQALATDGARMRVVAVDEGDGFALVQVEPARAG